MTMPSSFRIPGEVPVEEFDRIGEKQREFDNIESLVKDPQDRPTAASFFAEAIHGSDYTKEAPRQSKLEGFKRAIQLIDEGGEESNRNTAKILIDIVRTEPDMTVRLRMMAILSHDLQHRFLPAIPANEADLAQIMKAMKRIESFHALASGKDIPEAYQQWAQMLLDEEGSLREWNDLYAQDPNVEIPPIIQTDLRAIIENAAPSPDTSIADRIGQVFTGRITILPEAIFPSPEKIEEYERQMGRPLPVYVTLRQGAEYKPIPFPADITKELLETVARFRDSSITRKEVVEITHEVLMRFERRLNTRQLVEIEQAYANQNVEIRFGTEKSRWINAPVAPMAEERQLEL